MFKYLLTFSSFIILLSCTTDGLKIYEPDLLGPPSFTLSFTAGSGGSVSSPGGVYEEGSEVTITATPVSGYIFSGWSNGSADNPITLTVNSDTTLNATFTAIPTYSVTLTANSGGSVTGGGSYQEGTQVTLSATPTSGYIFSSWSDGLTDSNRTITISENITLSANFVETVYTYTLSVEAGNGGSVSSSGGVYEEGVQVTITASPDSGYTFGSWSNGSTENTITITLDSDLSLTANFETIPSFSISLNANSGGSVSGAGTYYQGAQVTISASPNSGYLFSSWSDGSTEQNRTISVTQNLTLTANFVESINNYSLSVEAGNGGSVSTIGGVYEDGTQVTITATPSSGFVFVSWSDGSTQQNRTITVTQNLTLTANFETIITDVLYLAENGVTIKANTTPFTDDYTGTTHEFNGNLYTIVNDGTLRNMVNNGEDLTYVVTTKCTNMKALFQYTDFNGDISSWDVSNVDDIGQMFSQNIYFNVDLSHWDVSNVTNMQRMFSGARSFNKDISSWDVSKVTNMYQMFRGAESFNQPLETWDVSNVTNMIEMLYDTPFNQPLANWDVSSVTNMKGLFGRNEEFNQDISSWNVSNVTNMKQMFYVSTFNQPLANWNVSSVTIMDEMFRNAQEFNQDISSWNVSNVTNMLEMFSNAINFNQDLSSWSVQSVTNCTDFSIYSSSWTLPKPNFTNCNPN